MTMETTVKVTSHAITTGNAAEIKNLVDRSNSLSHVIDRWNDGYVWAGAAALLIAGIVFLAQFVIIRKSRELSAVQSTLIAAKDRELTSDLAEKDHQLVGVRTQAKEADARIAEAQRGAAEATERATQAEAKLSLAEQHSAEANAKAEGFRLDIARANEAAEKERLARLKIEERLAGWSLSRDAQSRIADSLKAFSGTRYSLYANPLEQSFVVTIDHMLTQSGWIRETPLENDGNVATVLLDGKAAVAFFVGLHIDVSEDQWEALGPAAAAYKKALLAEGIDVKLLKALPPASKIAPTVMRVYIGRRE